MGFEDIYKYWKSLAWRKSVYQNKPERPLWPNENSIKDNKYCDLLSWDWSSTDKAFSLFSLHAWRMIYSHILRWNFNLILERKRDRSVCQNGVRGKKQNVLFCFYLLGKQLSPVTSEGHRECYLRTHSLHLLWSMCVKYETGIGQSQPRRSERPSCFSQFQTHIKYLEMSTFIISHYHYHRMRSVVGI